MHIAVVCNALGPPGAVASIALRQARELTRHARITLVSDSFPEDTAWAERRLVPMPDLHLLRRLRHVPDEVALGRGARSVLRSLPSVDFILAHAHSAAHISARGLGIPFGFFVHGDIFARPKGHLRRAVDGVLSLDRAARVRVRGRGLRARAQQYVLVVEQQRQ